MIVRGICVALLCIHLVNAQIAEPPIPAQVVVEKTDTASGSPCEVACAKLASDRPSQFYHKQSGNFDLWAGQQAEQSPECRVEPESAEDVSSILKVLTDSKCKFAIKSGGHARSAGSSNAKDGVTIDLARLNSVRISADRKSAHVGPGARWAEVYEAVEAEGLLVVGGRAGGVGVGGLILGGGLSFLSNRYGWACDNVLSYEIVLPNGEITTVDLDHHPDLYRALRGAGGTNFGIVTSMQLETVTPVNPAGFWYSLRFFDWSKLPDLLSLHHKILLNEEESLDHAFIHVYGYSQEYDMFMPITMHTHTAHFDNNTTPDFFKSYDEIEGLADPAPHISPYSKLTKDIQDQNPKPGEKRTVYSTFSYYPSLEMDEKMTALFKETIMKIKNVTGLSTTYLTQPVYKNTIQQMKKRGGNAVGLSKGPFNIASLAWTWSDASDDEIVIGAAREYFEAGEKMAKELGVYHPYKYLNYAETWQDVWPGYGQENLECLQSIQKKYDPEGIFTKGGLADGFFKLNTFRQKEEDVKDEL